MIGRCTKFQTVLGLQAQVGHNPECERGRSRERFLEEVIPEVYLKLSELKEESVSSGKEIEGKGRKKVLIVEEIM